MAFDVTFAALSHPLLVTPLGRHLHAAFVEFIANRNLVQQVHEKSKILVEKSGEREVGS